MKKFGSKENDKKYTVLGKSKEILENNIKIHSIRPGDRERVTKKDFQSHSLEFVLKEADHKSVKKTKKLGSHRLSELHFFRSNFK